ncbi:MAG: Type 1 glutamine amidotransferase-like domain-containing protein [Actinomycetota bacterium]
MNGPTMALLGSGEFEPWSEPVERWLLERSPNPGGVALVVPTAAAHEGEESFASWGAKGLEHYASLGIAAEVLPLRTRDDARREEIVGRLADASLIFFSGGNPARLAETLDGTQFWGSLLAAMGDGLPYAGCSAGVACLTETTYDSDTQDLEAVWAPGLRYLPDVLFGPHWDIVDTWIPGATEFIVGSVRPGQTFVGLDEATSMVGDGRSWRVIGRQKIHVLRDGEWSIHADGDTFELPLIG